MVCVRIMPRIPSRVCSCLAPSVHAIWSRFTTTLKLSEDEWMNDECIKKVLLSNVNEDTLDPMWFRAWQPCCELWRNAVVSCLSLILVFFIPDVVSLSITDEHLDIGSYVADQKPDFEFLHADNLFTETALEPFACTARLRPRKRKRGRRVGDLIRLRRRTNRCPLPWILLLNVQSLDNKFVNWGRESPSNGRRGTATLGVSKKLGC